MEPSIHSAIVASVNGFVKEWGIQPNALSVGVSIWERLMHEQSTLNASNLLFMHMHGHTYMGMNVYPASEPRELKVGYLQ